MFLSDWDWNWDHFKENVRQSLRETWDFDQDNPYIEGEAFFAGAMFAVVSLTCVIRALADGTWIVKVPISPVPKDLIFEPLVDYGLPETILLYFALISGIVVWVCIMLRSNEAKVIVTSKLSTCLLILNSLLLGATLVVWHTTHNVPAVQWWYSTGYFALCEAFSFGILAVICYLVDWLHLHFPSGSLTIARRKMILSTLITMTTMVVGALVFERMENWDFPTACM
jgi:hypothetical protein